MPAAPAACSLSPVARNLGRYVIERELGRGAQGRVYLAKDEQLERRVAIKTLAPGHDAQRAASLLDEARTTARLQHPNIVTLHDAFEHDGLLCLVLEYVPGDTLERLLQGQGALDTRRAVALTAQMLDGLAYAHERNIVHRDIKPANVLIDEAGNARVSDFGISAPVGVPQTATLTGTPRYMAPESFDSREVARGNDVFSVGMTLYEMLAGRPAVDARNVFEALHKIANQAFSPPSSHNPQVDEALDQIVMRAIAKDPGERYSDAAQMRQALEHYVRPKGSDPGSTERPEASGAIEFLLTRMRHKSSFPALSSTICAINRLTSGYEQSIQALSEVLLKDFALTNKLLKLVNSTGYGQYGGTISTISRAVMIMGFDAVRDLAVTLVLLEHLQNKGQANQLRDEVIGSLLTGILARRIAAGSGMRDAEEVFICGVMRHLGRLLVSFYLYDESVEIGRRMQHAGTGEAEASRSVLGACYEEIGIAIARSWNLPAAIVQSMRSIGTAGPVKSPAGPERLRVTASIADDLAQAAVAGTPAQRDTLLGAIAERYRAAVDLDQKQLTCIATDSVRELLADAAALLGDSRKSRFCQNLRETAGEVVRGSGAREKGLEQMMAQTACMPAVASGTDCEPAQVLAAGIQDITNTLIGDFDLSDLLRIILETMYRGMGFARVVLFMRNPGTFQMTARFGYGADMEQLIGRIGIPFGREQDVFSVALAKNVDLLISDIEAGNIRARIPEWFRASGLGRTFVLLPLVIEGRPVGLCYGDKAHAGELTIEQRELSLLKTLRNQAVLALRQRR